MNAIKTAYAIGLYTNLTHTSRFYNIEINKAVNDAIMKKIDSITDTVNSNQLTGIDRIQKYRDELFTLIKSATPSAPTGPTTITTIEGDFNIYHYNFPVDYQTYDRMSLLINGVTTYARDTTSNKIGPLLDSSFLKPQKKKAYFLEDSTGLLLYSSSVDLITSATLTYIKQPAEFKMGLESQYIDAGAGVLVNATAYIATEESVHNGVTYQPGDEFTSVNTNLTSGQVVLAANTTPIELPEKCHDQIAKMAAEILLGTVSAFDNSAFTEKEAS